ASAQRIPGGGFQRGPGFCIGAVRAAGQARGDLLGGERVIGGVEMCGAVAVIGPDAAGADVHASDRPDGVQIVVEALRCGHSAKAQHQIGRGRQRIGESQ
ncbi:hypothetical protein RZS08_55675, partial [Arthrospira platensis SPKY1]|nr:hypothetical protein [Arthrospira platensis SPKY1]